MLTDLSSAGATKCRLRNFRLRLVVLDVKIWLRYAAERRTFPVPVRENRFLAPLFVFMRGIDLLSFLGNFLWFHFLFRF